MIPLSRSVFWGPMAVSIMGGLVAATVLTLFFEPALYALFYRVKRPQEAAGREECGEVAPGEAGLVADAAG